MPTHEKNTAVDQTDAPIKLVMTRTFDAPRQLVWQAWTQHEHLMHWFAGCGCKVLFAESDLRIGGLWRSAMGSADGEKTFIHHGVYREIQPTHRLVFTHAWEQTDGDEPCQTQTETIITVTLAEKHGQTEMTFEQVGFDSIASRDSHEMGWSAAFEHLHQHLQPVGDNDDREMVITRVLDAPPQLVWQAWMDPANITRWWGPNGFTTTTYEMDIRPGGEWHFTMHGPDGRDYPNRVVYEEIEEPHRLVYSHRETDGVEPVCFQHTVTFEPHGENAQQTKLTMRMVFPSTAQRDEVARKYGAMEGGIQTVNRLAAYLSETTGRNPATLTLALPSACELTVSRTFDAPRELVWDAWTQPEMVKQWLYGPADWPMVRCEIELKTGGKLRYVWHNKAQGDMGLSGVFQEINPPRRLVHTELFDEDWTDGQTVVTTEFDERDGCTTMTATVRYSSPKARDAALQTPMLEGWGQALDRAADMLASHMR